jgi:outer membrane receptor protein involved in Fe transport
LNYSRRINRPNFWQLTPFTDSSDKLNPSRGNPALKPEFTNSVELSYEKTFENKDNLIVSAYYKYTDDLITRYQVAEDVNGGSETIILNTYTNANSSYVTGLELISRNKLTKWWEIASNLNIYSSDIDIDDPGQPDQEKLASWFGKLNNTFKLPIISLYSCQEITSPKLFFHQVAAAAAEADGVDSEEVGLEDPLPHRRDM